MRFLWSYDSVQFAGGDLFSPLHCCSHLLLVLLGQKWYHLSTDRIQTLCYLHMYSSLTCWVSQFHMLMIIMVESVCV